MQLTGIEEIKEIPECGQIEVRFSTAEGPSHYRVYEESMKDDFVADIDSPAHGGKDGDAAKHVTAIGWQ